MTLAPAMRLTVSGLAGAEVDIDRVAADTARISVRNTREATAANVRVSVEVPDAEEPHWLIPGLFYGENRPADTPRRYPRYAPVADHARLVAPSWAFRADRAATPVVFVWGRRGGVAIAAPQTTELGLTGI